MTSPGPSVDRALWSVPLDDLAGQLATDLARGLTSHEAAARLARDGPNVLAAAPPVPWWRRLGRQFADPLVILLLIAIAISLVAWWSEGATSAPLEAIVIAAIVTLNAGIGYWQEVKAVAAVAALRELTATHASVMRDGRVTRVPTAELVVGDVVGLAEGDAIGADCRLINASSLHVAEASLTGESTPVEKRTDVIDRDDVPLAERHDMVFSGTAVVRGRGEGLVVATGMATEIGRIATLIDEQEDADTPLQRQIAWLGRRLGVAVVALSAVVVAAVLATSDDHSFTGTVDALLVGVSLAVAAVPEGLPAIMSVVLALGVQRMALERAIVKRLSSVETLGSASVICSDKTGTLTRNEMTVVRVVTGSGEVELTGVGYEPVGQVLADGRPVADGDGLLDEVELVLSAGSLANDATLREEAPGRWTTHGDPTEIAFLVAEQKVGAAHRRHRWERVAEIPFTSDRRRMTTVHSDGGGSLVLAMKGAPDALLERCTRELVGDDERPLTDERRAAIEAAVDELASDALRTIAVAYRRFTGEPPDLDEAAERDLVHLGVVGIVDPPRPEVADAIAEARSAGIRIIMITGDHPMTATRIAESLGVGRAGGTPDELRSIAGADLRARDDAGFADAVREHSVFARVEPEHKLRIVEALQRDGEIVAMTGDGVNDAPALRRADIGVAMGQTGTEVSKEAADMILADDNFATILRAVREGREIFSDIRKVLRFLLASNSGEVLVVLVGVLAAGWLGLRGLGGQAAVPLLATQILWINLLTDGALALALGVDPAVTDVMRRRPRRLTDRVIDREMLVTIALIGVTISLASLAALDLRLPGGPLGGDGDLATARTMAFTTLVLGQVFNAFNARSDRVSAFVRPFENRLLWGSIGVTLLLQVAAVHLAFLQHAFDTAPLGATEWSICVGLASAVLWVDELRKLIVRARSPRTAPEAGLRRRIGG